MGALYVTDGFPTGEMSPLGEGLAEIKELISILRCRSFSGLLILQPAAPEVFPEAAARFFGFLEELGK